MIEVLHGQNQKYLGKKFSGDLWPSKRAMMDLQHGSWIAWIKFNEHKDTLLNRHVSLTLRFFFSHLFAAIRSQGTVFLVRFQALGLFLYWSVSRSAKSKGKVKSSNESGRMWGEAAAVCGVWWELCEEVTEGWGLAIEIVMVG